MDGREHQINRDEENRLPPETSRFPFAWKWRGKIDGNVRNPLQTEQTQTLEDLAEAIVTQDHEIVDKEIPDLSTLIDEVISHPNAKIAKLDSFTKKMIGVFDSYGNKLKDDGARPTYITIHGGVVHKCLLRDREIGFRLGLHTKFIDGAYFIATRFAAAVDFSRSRFMTDADFRGARFADYADFTDAQFIGPTYFSAHFADAAFFRAAHFSTSANFGSSHFADHADFREVHFADDGIFLDSQIEDLVDFSSATIKRRLLFAQPGRSDARFGLGGRLSFDHLFAQAGAAVEMSVAQLKLLTPHESDDARLRRWLYSTRFRDWFMEYLEAAIYLPLRDVYRPLANWLGIGQKGRLIEGEDSDDPEQLTRATEDYNRLRDFFRNQPSTDEQEEICNFKYLDLKRRTKLAEASIPMHRKARLMFLDWLVMRSALGYLIQWQRFFVTVPVVILVFAMIFWKCGTEETLCSANGNSFSEAHTFLSSLYVLGRDVYRSWLRRYPATRLVPWRRCI